MSGRIQIFLLLLFASAASLNTVAVAVLSISDKVVAAAPSVFFQPTTRLLKTILSLLLAGVERFVQ